MDERLHDLNDGCDAVFELWLEDLGVCKTGKMGWRKVREGEDKLTDGRQQKSDTWVDQYRCFPRINHKDGLESSNIRVILIYTFWGSLELILVPKDILSVSFWVRGWVSEKTLEFRGRDGLAERRWIVEDVGTEGHVKRGKKKEGWKGLPDGSQLRRSRTPWACGNERFVSRFYWTRVSGRQRVVERGAQLALWRI